MTFTSEESLLSNKSEYLLVSLIASYQSLWTNESNYSSRLLIQHSVLTLTVRNRPITVNPRTRYIAFNQIITTITTAAPPIFFLYSTPRSSVSFQESHGGHCSAPMLTRRESSPSKSQTSHLQITCLPASLGQISLAVWTAHRAPWLLDMKRPALTSSHAGRDRSACMRKLEYINEL